MPEKRPVTPVPISQEFFLKIVKEKFRISRVYYPGSAMDERLEGVFDREKIVYLDYEVDGMEKFTPPPFMRPRNVVYGNYLRAPFPDGVFDAIFFRDNHASEEDFAEMLRTLRPGGIVIMSWTCIGSMTHEKAAKYPGLNKIELPYKDGADEIEIFQKLPD